MRNNQGLVMQILSYLLRAIKDNLLSIGLIFVGLLIEYISGNSFVLTMSMLFAVVLILLDKD